MTNLSVQEIHEIITNAERADLVVKHANEIGNALSKSLNTAQIRALFGEVRQIEGQISIDHVKAWRRLYLLKPKMAYRVRKAQGYGVKDLVAILDPAIDEVLKAKGDEQQLKYFKNFVEFFEAILAYHKFHGGN